MLKKKLAMTTLAAAAALLMGGAQAAPTTISSGLITATINDAGNFASSSDPSPTPSGTPGLSYGGVEYVNHGTPISWYRFQNSAGDVTASLGSNPFSAVTYGAGTTAAVSLAFGSLSFVQTVAINSANILSVSVMITNNGADMRSVKWGVGFDPDQGISIDGSPNFATDNTILSQGANAAVRASYGGFETGFHTVTLRNTTSASAYSIAAYIDPYSCCSPVDPSVALSAGQLAGYFLAGDNSISLAYDLGMLASGKTASFGYEYVFAVPEPESYAMFLAGLAMIGVMVRRRTSV